jgi:hypothetical protein
MLFLGSWRNRKISSRQIDLSKFHLMPEGLAKEWRFEYVKLTEPYIKYDTKNTYCHKINIQKCINLDPLQRASIFGTLKIMDIFLQSFTNPSA